MKRDTHIRRLQDRADVPQSVVIVVNGLDPDRPYGRVEEYTDVYGIDEDGLRRLIKVLRERADSLEDELNHHFKSEG